jgi:hypothetical protein
MKSDMNMMEVEGHAKRNREPKTHKSRKRKGKKRGLQRIQQREKAAQFPPSM